MLEFLLGAIFTLFVTAKSEPTTERELTQDEFDRAWKTWHRKIEVK